MLVAKCHMLRMFLLSILRLKVYNTSINSQEESRVRIKAVIAYNGKAFQGFQKQSSTKQTVTTAIEEALHTLGIDTSIVGSGRTDAGVHAAGQVIHFDLPPYWHDLTKLTSHLNGKLDHIAFKHISPVGENFHARFSAKRRIYRYIIKTSFPTIFEKDFVSHMALEDISVLETALQMFAGEHDFGFFLKSGSETKNNIREIYKAYHIQRGRYHYLYFEANGFLRAQVRMMADFAVRVANGELCHQQLDEQLNLQAMHSRRLAPPQGLYLARVLY